MITMMVLLCYVNVSGMSLECIVIVLMNNLPLGGQECTDFDDISQRGDEISDYNRTAIIPRLNFTCSGRITSITARMWFEGGNSNYPFFQVWQSVSVGSTIYSKVGEVQLQSEDQFTLASWRTQIATIILTAGDNAIEVQSGDVVGYYHPPDARFSVITRETDGYTLYQLSGSSESIDLNSDVENDDRQQPVIQFTIGKYVFNQPQLLFKFKIACS